MHIRYQLGETVNYLYTYEEDSDIHLCYSIGRRRRPKWTIEQEEPELSSTRVIDQRQT